MLKSAPLLLRLCDGREFFYAQGGKVCAHEHQQRQTRHLLDKNYIKIWCPRAREKVAPF